MPNDNRMTYADIEEIATKKSGAISVLGADGASLLVLALALEPLLNRLISKMGEVAEALRRIEKEGVTIDLGTDTRTFLRELVTRSER
jgi:hypothetical protein